MSQTGNNVRYDPALFSRCMRAFVAHAVQVGDTPVGADRGAVLEKMRAAIDASDESIERRLFGLVTLRPEYSDPRVINVALDSLRANTDELSDRIANVCGEGTPDAALARCVAHCLEWVAYFFFVLTYVEGAQERANVVRETLVAVQGEITRVFEAYGVPRNKKKKGAVDPRVHAALFLQRFFATFDCEAFLERIQGEKKQECESI